MALTTGSTNRLDGVCGVVVGVVRGIARLGVDLAGPRVHHHGRYGQGPVGDRGGHHLLLDGQLEVGVDREGDVLAGRAGVDDLGRIDQRPAGDRAGGKDHLRATRQGVLVVLLDAVLADSVAVDEAEQLGRQRRLGSAADLRLDPGRLGRQVDARGGIVGVDRHLEPVGRLLVQVVGEDDVRPVRVDLLAEGRRVDRRQSHDPDQVVRQLGPVGGVRASRLGLASSM